MNELAIVKPYRCPRAISNASASPVLKSRVSYPIFCRIQSAEKLSASSVFVVQYRPKGIFMKKAKSASGDVRPEYKTSDFKKLERGKYYERVKASSNVVVLDPEVSVVFPNSAAVNKALRSLVEVATSVSSLSSGSSRSAHRRRSSGELKERRKAMQAVVGMWKDRGEFSDPVKYVRSLRRDKRMDRLAKERS